jgi:hypothetical protein
MGDGSFLTAQPGGWNAASYRERLRVNGNSLEIEASRAVGGNLLMGAVNEALHPDAGEAEVPPSDSLTGTGRLQRTPGDAPTARFPPNMTWESVLQKARDPQELIRRYLELRGSQ